jgi:hypothetical protein
MSVIAMISVLVNAMASVSVNHCKYIITWTT